MYLPARICCTTLAGTGRSDIERLNPLSSEVFGSNQSGTCGKPPCWLDDDGMLEATALQAAGNVLPGGKQDNGIVDRETGGGRLPKGV